MILEQLTIRNWRGYRETHRFRFENGFNLIVGRNESGKSTLFEALTRVLFDRYNSKTAEIRQMQPLGSSLGPEATLTFVSNGRRYRVIKRFLHQPICELHTEKGGEWQRIHEGDRADDELRNVLQGLETGRVTKPEHRGLAQALWYLQREQPLPEKAWADSIKNGLSGLVQLVVKSPDEDQIVKLIEKNYSTYFTPTGKNLAGSEITTLQNEISGNEEALQKLRDLASGVEKLRLELEELTESKTLKEKSLEEAQKDLEDAKTGLEAATLFEEKKRTKEKAYGEAEKRLQEITKDYDAITRRQREIEKVEKELEQTMKDSESLQADAMQEHLAEERHHQTWKDELEPALKRVEEDLKSLGALEQLQHLKKEEKRLQEHQERLDKAKNELLEKKRKLTKLLAPSKKEWTEFQEWLSQLRIAEAKAEASAIRVGFDLKDKSATVKTSPPAHFKPDQKEYLITSPTTFTIKDIGKVWVRGVGASVEELDTTVRELRKATEATLDRFSVKDAQALSDLYQRHVDLEKEVRQSQKRFEEIAGEETEPEGELARIKERIEGESQRATLAKDEWKKWDTRRVREKVEEFEKEKNRMIKGITEEQKREKKARDMHLELTGKTQEASNRVTSLRSRINSLGQENAETLKAYGTVKHLESQIEQAKEGFDQIKNDLDTLLKGYEVAVELPKKLHHQAGELVRNLEIQLKKIEQEMVDRKARIEEAASQGVYSEMADLEALLDVKRKRLETLKRRAEGTRLLQEMVLAYKKDQSAALVGPVAGLVNGWLRLLTEGTYETLELSEEMIPVAVRSNRYDELMPLESLSFGTHEQVIVLLRLAIGVLLSNKERNLVVIDDRLVNADTIRLKRLCLILEEVATKFCQVVVATCNDTPYAGIKGHIIHVPLDGMFTEA